MSYCVNCGVELAQSEKKCPLCGTEVVNPHEPERVLADSPYPRRLEAVARRMDRHFFAQLAGLLMLIPMLMTVLVNLLTSQKLTWSFYVIGASFLGFVCAVLPFYFKRYYTLPFVAADCVAATLFVWLIELLSDGEWFIPLGLPICASASLFIILLAAAFSAKQRMPGLVRVAMVLLSAGLFTVSVNIIISEYTGNGIIPSWSLYALAPCLILGIAALIVERRKNFKEQIKKRLFF